MAEFCWRNSEEEAEAGARAAERILVAAEAGIPFLPFPLPEWERGGAEREWGGGAEGRVLACIAWVAPPALFGFEAAAEGWERGSRAPLLLMRKRGPVPTLGFELGPFPVRICRSRLTV